MSKDFRDIDYLGHIRDAIAKIQRYVIDKSETEFMASELVQDGVIRNLEIIGEAVSKLSPGLKAEYSDVPWSEVSGMRNRLIHGYMYVNPNIVWDTVQKVLPEFLGTVNAISKVLEAGQGKS